MKDMQGVNIPMPTTAMETITSEMGLNLVDLGFVQLLMRSVLPPEKADRVNKILQNIADSMNTMASLAQVSGELTREAMTQRDAALAWASEATEQRNAAIHEIDQLRSAVQQIDQTEPDVAALVLRVWTDAQADILQQLKSQKGA